MKQLNCNYLEHNLTSNLNFNNTSLPCIEGFHCGTLPGYSNSFFYISHEVFDYSNAKNPGGHVMDIYNIFIKSNLIADGICVDGILDNCVIVLAHGKSTTTKWKIFLKKQDNEGIDIEDFIAMLPKDKKIILYCCNEGFYTIKKPGLNIIYPMGITKSAGVRFKIQGDLFEALK